MSACLGSQRTCEFESVSCCRDRNYWGYVYDVETGLYYLRSRYYKPECGRFLNADCFTCYNQFTYCNNSPVTLSDDNGTKPTDNHTLMPASYLVEHVKTMYEDEWLYNDTGDKREGFVDCIGVILYCVKLYFGGWITNKGKNRYKIKIDNRMVTIGQGTGSAITYNIKGHETQLRRNIIPTSTTDIENTLLPGMILYSSDLGHVGVYVGYYYDEESGKTYQHAVIHSPYKGQKVKIEEVTDSPFKYYAKYNYIDYNLTYKDTLPQEFIN